MWVLRNEVGWVGVDIIRMNQEYTTSKFVH